MKKTLLFFALMSLLIAVPVQADSRTPSMQIALLLDTSNSMDGLINQARTQLWKIVNELALAKQNGETPNLEVALYEYGKDSLSAKEGYIQMLVPLTDDLDKVSEALFALQTNGGNEFCGQVIQTASAQLTWSTDPHAYKAIFIAGNEPFTQGPVDFRNAVPAAIAKSILVNTIFCGPEQQGIQGLWKQGADLGDGRFMSLDQNQALVHIEAPQDAEILRLGKEINQTYVAYGKTGNAAKERQARQDNLSAGASNDAAVNRALVKKSKMYKTESWDMVTAVEEGKVALEEMEEDALPEPMKDMDLAERKAYIAENKAKRDEITQRLNQLEKERRTWLADQVQQESIDAHILDAIRKQAVSKGYVF